MRRLLIACPGMVPLFLSNSGPGGSSNRALYIQSIQDASHCRRPPRSSGMYDLATITPFERPSGAPCIHQGRGPQAGNGGG